MFQDHISDLRDFFLDKNHTSGNMKHHIMLTLTSLEYFIYRLTFMSLGRTTIWKKND